MGDVIKFFPKSNFQYFRVWLSSYQRYAYWIVNKKPSKDRLITNAVELSGYGWIGNYPSLLGVDQLKNDLTLNPEFLTRLEMVEKLGEELVKDGEMQTTDEWFEYFSNKLQLQKYGSFLPLIKFKRQIFYKIKMTCHLTFYKFKHYNEFELYDILHLLTLSGKELYGEYTKFWGKFNSESKIYKLDKKIQSKK